MSTEAAESPASYGRRTKVFPAKSAGGLGGLSAAWPFLIVGVLLYAALVIFPVLQTLWLSLFKWNGSVGKQTFVGFSNYARMFRTDPVFGTALKNSLIWTALSLIVPNAIALALAVVLNGPIKGRVALRAAFYLPSVLATVVVAMTWNMVYDPLYGVLNNLLQLVGLGEWAQPWLGNPDTALYAVFFASVWHGTGGAMILFLAGLQTVRGDLLDAAKVDGANRLEVFWFVELPALRPTIVVVLLLSVIGSLKSFDLVFAMTNGGPADASQLLAAYSWTAAINHHDVGLGAAVATFLFGLSALVVVPYLRWTLKDWGMGSD